MLSPTQTSSILDTAQLAANSNREPVLVIDRPAEDCGWSGPYVVLWSQAEEWEKESGVRVEPAN